MKKTTLLWGSLIPTSKQLILTLCLVGIASPSFASNSMSTKGMDVQVTEQSSITVKGIVKDPLGDPLTGVSISIEGTTIGVMTDIDGNYSISAPNKDASIIFSYIGFTTQKKKVGNNTTMDVTLEEDSRVLDEVVVTALGMSRSKKALGYSLTELKGDELSKSNLVSPVNALQGKVAGVQINMGSSGPQSSQRIMIRGNTSISGNNQPIFVIDGIIIDNETTKTGDKNQRDFGNDLKNLNSDDFETVSVLKGAAATALYGSRASNGVILITTKQGKKGEGLGISLSHTQGWDVLYDTPKMQNEFGTTPNTKTTLWPLDKNRNEHRTIASAGGNFGPRFDGEEYTNGSYTGLYKGYKDNLKDFYKTGRYINTNLAISGGTDKSTFRFSYSNLDTEGNTPNNTFTRNNFSLNASHDISKIVSVKAGFAFVTSKTANPTYQGGDRSPVYDFMYSLGRDYDLNYWKKNYENANRDGYNEEDPWGYTKTLYEYYNNNDESKEDNFRGNIDVDFKLTDWITLTVKGDINKIYKTRETKKLSENSTSKYEGAKYRIDDFQKQQYRFTALLSANRKVGDIGLSGSVGVEQWDTRSQKHNSWTNGGLRVPGRFDISNSVSLASTEVFRNTDRERVNSVYAFLNTDWKNQIYVDITGRNDWSSNLRYSDGSGNVSYFYPSFSTSWLATETFRDAIPEVISFAKLRGSYAIVGQDCKPYQITNPGVYENANIYNDVLFGGGTHAYNQFKNEVLGAKDLKPEKQHAIEFGAEARFFDDRLGIDFAYYKTNTKNQILELGTAKESGVEKQIINAGDIQNSGIELLINGTPFRNKDWNWDLSVNFTRNRNKIKKLSKGVSMYELSGGGMETKAWAVVGGAYGDIYTTKAFKRDEEGNKLIDANGQWVQAGEQTKVGSLQPKFLAGMTSDLRWKNVSFGIVIDARIGGDIMSGSYNYGMNSGVLKSSLFGRTEEYGGLPRLFTEKDANGQVTREVHDGMIPNGVFQAGTVINGVDYSGQTYQSVYESGAIGPIAAYDYYTNLYGWDRGIREQSVRKSSWVALRELSLNWAVPSSYLKPIFVKSASVGLVVRNVGYLYNSLPDNIHPEGLVTTYTSEYLEGGGSLYTRNFSIKVNLTF